MLTIPYKYLAILDSDINYLIYASDDKIILAEDYGTNRMTKKLCRIAHTLLLILAAMNYTVK